MNRLPLLEQRIRDKIQQAKDEIFPGHNRIYLEALRIENRNPELGSERNITRNKNTTSRKII